MKIEEIQSKYCIDALSSKYSIEYWKGKGVKILDTLPSGWKFIKGALTAPDGYEWANNGKSRFGGEYKNALVKVR